MKLWFWAALAGIGISGGIHAQVAYDSLQITRLEEVVVADTRFPLSREKSGKIIVQLNAKELERYAGFTVADILNRQPGLELSGSRGRPGAVLGVFARGGRGQQVLVLIDGVRMSDPSSYSRAYDLRMLPASQISAIEILKGPSSTLYGSNAATVVINITTRKLVPDTFSIEAGSFAGTLRSSAGTNMDLGKLSNYFSVTGRKREWFGSAAIAQEYHDGLSSLAGTSGEKDPNSLWRASLLMGKSWKEGPVLTAFLSQNGLKTSYDDAYRGIDAPYSFNSKQLRAGFQLTANESSPHWEWQVAYTDFKSEDRGEYPNTYSGSRLTSEFTYKKEIGTNWKVLSGLSLDRDYTSDNEFLLADPYVNVVYNSSRGWNLNTGVRLNMHSTYGSNGVYQINPSRVWKTGKGTVKILSSWSTAYITPSLMQLYGNFGANPDLQPETNRGLEVGSEWYNYKTTLHTSLLYFNRSETNLVVYDGALAKFYNAGSAIQAQGVEFQVKGRLFSTFDFNTYYTYTHRKGDDALRIPRHKAGLVLDVNLGKQSRFILDYQYTGSRPDMDFSTFLPVNLEPFSLLDVRWQYTLKAERSTIYALISNALNTRFEEILGYSTPGRNFGLGWTLRIN